MATVVAAVIEREGRILIGQRCADRAHPLKWEFPGGKVERGEEARDALARELWEELRLRAVVGTEILRYEYSYGNNAPILLVFFRIEGFFGTPENRVFNRLEWAPPAELRRYDFLEGDGAIVELLSGPASAKTAHCDPDSDAS